MSSETGRQNGSPALMRRINSARVVHELRSRGPQSRANLARVTGLSKPTVTSVIEGLDRRGFVVAVDGTLQDPGAGRRPQLYAFRADMGYVLGVDIGADKLLLMLADLDGDVVATRRKKASCLARRGAEAIIAELAKAADQMLGEVSVDRDRLLLVVVGTPGVVSPDGIVTLAPQLAGWEGLDLRAALASTFGCAVHVERELTLSLAAERWRGVAQDLDDALYIHLGVGVGAALLLNGQIYRGAHGAAGEVGSMPLGLVAPPLPGLGSFESATGGAALARDGCAAARTPAGSRLLALAGGDPDAVDALTVFTASAAGDPAAGAIVARAVEVLAQGIACLVWVLDPQTVIISGGLSSAGDVLLNPLSRAVERLVPVPPQFLISSLGDEAVVLGALRLAIQTVENDLFASPDGQAMNRFAVQVHGTGP